MKAYYHARAPEYDDWWLGRGRFGGADRPGWDEELAELQQVIARLRPVRTLDVACGTGFLTTHLRGTVVGLDQSAAMLSIARERAPHVTFVEGDALALPFEDDAFDRVFTSYFYCHLEEPERERFLEEARRVAQELVVVAAPLAAGRPPAEWQERLLADGSRWTVYKRLFDVEPLLAELGGGDVLHSGRWFIAVRSPRA